MKRYAFSCLGKVAARHFDELFLKLLFVYYRAAKLKFIRVVLRKELLKESSGQHSVLFAEIFKYTEN